mmetsp:Transcript_15844/g.61907  ORF Transcript_15844/g.61907 Transcript_15844/m.61907 type:complete len:439 (+) Transcript_15844:171-1487(+)
MSYTRLPTVPYLYGATINHYVFTRQAWRDVDEHETVFEGVSSCRGQERDMFWPSTALDLAYFASSKFTFNVLSRLALRFGVVQEPSAPPPDPVQTRLEMLFLEHQLRELSLNKATAGTKLADGEVGPLDLRKILEEKKRQYAEEKRGLKERQQRIEAGEMVDQGDSVSTQQFLGCWGLSTATLVATNALLYPFTLVSSWLMAQETDIGWTSAAKLLWEARKNAGKSVYDGFLPHVLYGALHSLLIAPPMNLCKKLFRIPPEYELRTFIVRLGLLGQMQLLDDFHHDDDHEDPVRKKREFVTAFRSLTKNTISYQISNWAVAFPLFPLLTVRNKLAAQGASYLCPWRYSGFLPAVRGIYRAEGSAGFYRGIGGHAIKLLPELISMGCMYVAVSLLIEFLFDEEEFDSDLEDDMNEYSMYDTSQMLEGDGEPWFDDEEDL